MPYVSIENQDQIENLNKIFESKGPIICDIAICDNQKIEPFLKFGAGLEELDPKLSVDELSDIMNS